MHKPIISGTLGNQSEKFKNYKKRISISIDTNSHIKSEVNIYLQIEPEELLNHNWLTSHYKEFDIILCWEEKLLSLPNSKLFPFGTCWIDSNKNYKKEFAISHIYSNKTQLPGHSIRQRVGNVLKQHNIKYLNISTPPRIEAKEILFDGYQYSIIIENIIKKNWFTEKLIDCLVTSTIPIYYGCPNIADYFDDSYFLKFNTETELHNILSNLSDANYYNHVQKISQNKNKAKEFVNIWKRLDTIFKTL